MTREDFLKDLVIQFIDRRKALALTQDEVNSRMGNADRLVSKWECGERTPNSFNLYCWAITLNCQLTLTEVDPAQDNSSKIEFTSQRKQEDYYQSSKNITQSKKIKKASEALQVPNLPKLLPMQ